jgi:tRNA threonylcarbamoyladenosine biosynthesis protein TsaB
MSGGVVLALDAAGPGASVALLRDGRALAEIRWVEPRSAGTRLLAWVDDLVTTFGRPEAVAVGIGPGSFTGVRVAVTAAKTLAWAWGVPLYAVSSLAAQAVGAPVGAWVLTSLERRGSAVYVGLYRVGREGLAAAWPDTAWTVGQALALPTDVGRLLVAGPLGDDAAWLATLPVPAEPFEGVSPARGVAWLATRPGVAPVAPLGLEPAYLRPPPGRTVGAPPGG